MGRVPGDNWRRTKNCPTARPPAPTSSAGWPSVGNTRGKAIQSRTDGSTPATAPAIGERSATVVSTPSGAVIFGMHRLRSRTGFRSLAVTVVISVAAICAGCGGGSDASGTRSTSNPSHSTTTNPQASAVLAAYRAEQAAFEAALQHADPTFPALAQTMTGNQLDVRTTGTRRGSDKRDRRTGDCPVESQGRVHSRQLRRSVSTVAFDSIELVYSATGKPVPPVTPPQQVGVKANLTRSPTGVWKVADQNVTDGCCPAEY